MLYHLYWNNHLNWLAISTKFPHRNILEIFHLIQVLKDEDNKTTYIENIDKAIVCKSNAV